jgi:histidinol-phosphate/aromatic aminotransferase/cobyric acid decarboxylase-like protein/adenosyl cobinamide kinase/adenosyl cobinamide phosphate guanylyltransferase
MGLMLVLGGIASGKSRLAEALATASGRPVRYLATAHADDLEMRERIRRHRARRPAPWETVEGDPLTALGESGEATVLLESLGPWLARLMDEAGLLTDAAVEPLGNAGEEAAASVLERVRTLAFAAAARQAPTIVVAEESGLGTVPRGAGTRRYLDLAGRAAELLADAAEQVLLVVAGRPLELKAPLADHAPLRVHGDRLVPPGALDFAVNIHPARRPPHLTAALAAALEQDTYPDEQPARLALAERHRRPPEEVLPTNGACEAFWLIAQALKPRLAACVHPSFTEPEAALRAVGCPVVHVLRRPDAWQLEPEAVPEQAELVVLGNPNNPTGTLDAAETIAQLVRPGRMLVVDESFIDFVPEERESVAARRDLPGLVVVRSLTKLWSLAGVRAGYLLGPTPLVARLEAGRQPWSVNSLACAALEACASDRETPARVAVETATARAALYKRLRRISGVRVWPSAANFLLLHVPDGPRALAELERLRIAVRPAASFPGLTANHLRVAVRDAVGNERLALALAEAIAA